MATKIKKCISSYQEIIFLIPRNASIYFLDTVQFSDMNYFLISRNVILDIKKVIYNFDINKSNS